MILSVALNTYLVSSLPVDKYSDCCKRIPFVDGNTFPACKYRSLLIEFFLESSMPFVEGVTLFTVVIPNLLLGNTYVVQESIYYYFVIVPQSN